MACNPYLNSRLERRFDEDLDFIAQRFGKPDEFLEREVTQAPALQLGHSGLADAQKVSGFQLG